MEVLIEQRIPVYLAPLDAEAFKLFQKHYVAFKMLDSVGAFNIKAGSVTIDFDREGQIKGINKQEMFRP